MSAQEGFSRIQWTPNPLDRQQQAAAGSPVGPVFIDGAPGTGKTHTLRARVATLLKAGADPSSIVVLTKTTLAAEEFAVALADILEMDGRVAGITLGTFHAYARNFTRRFGALALDIDPDYTLWGPDQCLLALEQLAGDRPEATGAGISHRDARRIRGWLSRNRTRVDLPPIPPADDIWRELRDAYAAAKRQQHALDADDLLDVVVGTLRKYPKARDAGRQHGLQHLVIDDFQDVTPAQYELVRLLAGPEDSVVVAVDWNSAVLSSRGGDSWLIGQFLGHYRNASRHRLTLNHRATKSLSETATAVQDSDAMPGVRTKDQTSDREVGAPPCLVVHDGSIAELDRRVVSTLREHNNTGGYDWNDMAFLYADPAAAQRLTACLRAHDIPCRDLGWPTQPGAPDLLAVQNLLILALNACDGVAMHNVMRAGLSSSQEKQIADAMRALREIASDQGGDLLRAARQYVQKRARSTVVTRRMGFIIDTVPTLRTAMAQDDAGMEGVIRLAHTQFREKALSNPHPQPTADLLRFFDIADRIADATTPLRAQFLRLFDFLADASDPFHRTSLTVGSERDGRAITLCPIHMAQGFQWRVVFLLDCVDEKMLGHAADGDEDVRDEAQRRFYVAVTRARDFLYICCPLVDANCVNQTPSRYIAALGPVLEAI